MNYRYTYQLPEYPCDAQHVVALPYCYDRELRFDEIYGSPKLTDILAIIDEQHEVSHKRIQAEFASVRITMYEYLTSLI